MQPRTALFRPDLVQPDQHGLLYDEISTNRITMLQFTDDRQVRPGTFVGVSPDATKVRPLKEAKRPALEACGNEIRRLLDPDKQVYYCEDMWMTGFTPEDQTGGLKNLWWTGVTLSLIHI